MKHSRLNHIIIFDKKTELYYLFERMGKKVPLEAYNKDKALASSDSKTDLLKNPNRFASKSWGSLGENLGKSKLKTLKIPYVHRWDIEEKPYEVVFND